MAALHQYARWIFLAAVLTVCLCEEKYSSKFDNVDVELILRTPRLLKQYERCYLGTSACITPDARFLKDTFPEALVTKCRRCTEKQKHIFETITVWYVENDPTTWDKILKNSIGRFQSRNA